MKNYLILLFFFTISSLFLSGQVVIKPGQAVKMPIEIERKYKKIDSLCHPVLESCIDCYIGCAKGDSSKLKAVAGYITLNVSFDKMNIINKEEVIPFKPKSGDKNLLFIHLEPNFEKKDKCATSNIVLFTQIEDINTDKKTKISSNTSIAMFTGGPYYSFPVIEKPKGWIQIKKIEKKLYKVKVKIGFRIEEEEYNSLNIEFNIREISGIELKKI